MVSRVNISIPDELDEELKNYKDELPDKVSAICQRALMSEIQKIKNDNIVLEQMKNDPSLLEIINRLKEERDSIKKSVVKLAKQDASGWIKTISFSKLFSIYGETLTKIKTNEPVEGEFDTYNSYSFSPSSLGKIRACRVIYMYLMDSVDLEEYDIEIDKYTDLWQDYRAFKQKILYYISKKLNLENDNNITSVRILDIYIEGFTEILDKFWSISRAPLLYTFEETTDE